MKQYKIQKNTEVIPFSFCIRPDGILDVICSNDIKTTIVDWEFYECNILATYWALKNDKYFYVLFERSLPYTTSIEIVGFRVLRQWVDEL
jgi:hypothetical protein